MNHQPQQPQQPQHYRMTLEDAIAHYKEGDLTAKGALKMWIRIRLKKTWQFSIDPSELRQQFGMKRSTFWDALHKLEEEREIEFSEPEKLTIKRLPDKADDIQKTGQPSEKPDSHPENRTAIQKTGQPSKKPDEQQLETRHQGGCSSSSNSSQSSYQIFLISLSDTQRESFQNFCRNEVAGLPRPIVNLGDYLAAVDASGQPRYLDFWQRFTKTLVGQEVLKQTLLNPELYEQWEKEFRAIGCDYFEFVGIAQQDSDEWELRVKFCQEWERRQNAVPVLY